MGIILAVVADTHVGGVTALSLPVWETVEGQQIIATKAQEWLYACWQDFWRYVYRLKKESKYHLVTVHLGDIIDGLQHGNVQALPELIDQENEACELLKPIRNISDGGFFVCLGTEAHAGAAAQSEQRVAREVGATKAAWSITLEVDGYTIDCSHHGRAGGREWTSSAANMAVEVVVEYLSRGCEAPRFILRGHRHVIDDSGEKLRGVRAICLPSWQLKNAYGWRVAPGMRTDIGGLVIMDGMIDWSHARYEAAPGQREVFKCQS
jgi:hypothetical protein